MTVTTQEPQRVRYAKQQINRVVVALERIDPEALDQSIRVLELEDLLRERTEQSARWRRLYEVTADLLGSSGDERIKRLDSAMREWVGRA